MISVEFFYECLSECDVDFFSGVPDSLLKDICAYVTDHVPKDSHIIAANEGGALSIGIGYHLATKKVPLIYMQNSGLGNIINPLLSLADSDVYSIPMILMIGWRGEPGINDEPQHKKQGRVTEGLLKSMEIPYIELTKDMDEIDVMNSIKDIYSTAVNKNTPCAILVRKGVFSSYQLQAKSRFIGITSREKALKLVVKQLSDSDVVVSTTGMTSRELFEYREECGDTHKRDFLTVGGMGHACQIALGVAINKPEKQVVCLDGDGAFLMHMGSTTINASIKCNNFKHIVFNNAAHDSVGGQPTVANNINIPEIALASGYEWACRAANIESISNLVEKMLSISGPALLEICVTKGSRADLGRPTSSPKQNKKAFMEFLG